MVELIGLCHEKAVPPSIVSAFKAGRYAEVLPLILPLAEGGSLEAAIMVANVYFCGGNHVHKDYARARYWLESIVKNSTISFATFRLAVIYYKGLGVNKDLRKAYRLFRSGGLQGHNKSLMMIGIMHSDGNGVVLKKTRTASVIFYRCMRDGGLSLGQRALAFLWMVGASLSGFMVKLGVGLGASITSNQSSR